MKRFIAYLCLIFLGLFSFEAATYFNLIHLPFKEKGFDAQSLPTTIQVKTPLEDMLLTQQENNRYCYSKTKKCGTLIPSERGFRLTIQNKTEFFVQKENGIYQRVRQNTDDEILREKAPIQIQTDNKVLSFQQDIYGNLINTEGNLFGKILSQSNLSNQKTHLFILKDQETRLYEKNKDSVFIEQAFQNKNHKILAFIPSYKRPIFLSGQILRLKNQTYQNFDISVSIKGFHQHESKLTFETEWRDLIDQNRLFISYDENSTNQVINVIHSFNKIDLEKYDYFCKINDDDWYAPTYFETINRHLSIQEGILLTSMKHYFSLENENTHAYLSNSMDSAFGGTFCFHQSVAEELMYTLRLPDEAIARKYSISLDTLKNYYKDQDDVFMLMVTNHMKQAVTQTLIPSIPLFIYTKYPSVTRK